MTTNEKSITYTHRTLNFLYASYQGEFAFLNILSQFKHPEFSKDHLIKTKEDLKFVKSCLEKLWQGEVLFSPEASQEKQVLQKNILTRLSQLKDDLNKIGRTVKGLAKNPGYHFDKNDVVFLIASFGRAAYAKDNFIRGVLKFEKLMKREQDKNSEQYISDLLKYNLKLTNDFLRSFKNPDSLNLDFYNHLRFSCRTLAGIFRTQSHDIIQILAGTKPEVSFKEAGFHEIEAKVWQQMGYNAIEAGYWRAFEMSAEEVQLWKDNNFIDPLLTAEWKEAGFNPMQAIQWFEVLFTPLLAIQWNAAKIAPRDSALLVDLGYPLPSDIPEGKLEQLLDQAYKQFPDDQEPEF